MSKTSESRKPTVAISMLAGTLFVGALLSGYLFLKVSGTSGYDPTKVFSLQFHPPVASPERTGSGYPGPTYWTNRADYNIQAHLDTRTDLLSGTTTIHYTNNSPHTLSYLWLQLYQNIYRTNSLAELTTPYDSPFGARIIDGMRIASVSISEHGRGVPVLYHIQDSCMRVDLPHALTPHGGTIDLVIDYSFAMSPINQGPRERMGISNTDHGPIYAVAHWYPRMFVYDDLHGWNARPYRAVGEFYLDYGDYDVSIDVPWNFIVAGPGALLNSSLVLSKQEFTRLQRVATDTQTVQVASPSDVGHRSASLARNGRLTWHFLLKNARDFAWAASPAFVWDAAGVDLPNHTRAVAMAFYPQEVASHGWANATEYLRQSLQFMSQQFIEYPYPTATAVTTDVSGMEYPSMVFLTPNKSGQEYLLRRYLIHEIGHTLFPMIVGSDEQRYAWMDEGFDTFENWWAINLFNGQKPLQILDSGTAAQVAKITEEEKYAIMTGPDDMPEQDYYPVEYVKTAYGLALLREYILDNTNTFDTAFKNYITAWAYKHPAPDDFFRLMNNETGQNLDWFWNEWFFQTWKLDQSVEHVGYNKDPSDGSLITIRNKQQMALPVVMDVTECNGQVRHIKLPAEIWSQGSTWTLKLATHDKLKSVILDPNELLPDIDRSNNSWTGHCLL